MAKTPIEMAIQKLESVGICINNERVHEAIDEAIDILKTALRGMQEGDTRERLHAAGYIDNKIDVMCAQTGNARKRLLSVFIEEVFPEVLTPQPKAVDVEGLHSICLDNVAKAIAATGDDSRSDIVRQTIACLHSQGYLNTPEPKTEATNEEKLERIRELGLPDSALKLVENDHDKLIAFAELLRSDAMSNQSPKPATDKAGAEEIEGLDDAIEVLNYVKREFDES